MHRSFVIGTSYSSQRSPMWVLCIYADKFLSLLIFCFTFLEWVIKFYLRPFRSCAYNFTFFCCLSLNPFYISDTESEWNCNIYPFPFQWLLSVQTVMKYTSIDYWKIIGRGYMFFKRYLISSTFSLFKSVTICLFWKRGLFCLKFHFFQELWLHWGCVGTKFWALELELRVGIA